MSASWLPTASQRVARAGTDTIRLTLAMLSRPRCSPRVEWAVLPELPLRQVSSDSDPDALEPPDGDPASEDWEEDDDCLPPPRVAPPWWEGFGADFDDDEPQPEPGDFWPDDDDRDDRCETGQRPLRIQLPEATLPPHASNSLHVSGGTLAWFCRELPRIGR
jgi:hypothetical protein